jgi:serine/threonine-protein kinase RsbW
MRAHLTVRVHDGAMREVEDFVDTFAAEHGLATDDRARTLIVLEELLTNLSRYGYSGKPEAAGVAEITLELEGDKLTIEFGDDGQPFDPLAKAAPDLEQSVESRPVGGLGIHMVRELAAEVHYNRRDDRNIIRLTRRVVLEKSR